MSNLPISSKYRSQPHLPVSDDEREDLVARLNQAFSDGLISQDDYQGLLDRVFESKTLGELVPVVEMVPARPTHNSPAIVGQAGGPPPGQLAPSTNARQAALVTLGVAGAGAVLLLLLLLVVLL